MSPDSLPQQKKTRLTSDQRISKILATTRQLLSEKGYENIVTSEIAARCKVSEATLFKYFSSKRELLIAVAEKWFAEIISSVRTTEIRNRSVQYRLRQLIWESLSIIKHDPALSRFILMELRADVSYRSMYIYQLNRQFIDRLNPLLEEAISSGEFRNDISLGTLRKMIFGSIEHQTWSYLRGEGNFDLEKVSDEIASVIYRGMATMPPNEITPKRASNTNKKIKIK